jgi:methyl-accepting chemotaxis protein
MSDAPAVESAPARLASFGLDSDQLAAFRRMRPAILAALPGLLESFYARTLADPQLAALFTAPGMVEQAKAAQHKHWARLFEGRFDEAFLQSAHRIGLAHSRIGLAPEPYVAAYGYVLGELIATVVNTQTGWLMMPWRRRRLRESLAAVVRGVLVDVGIAMGTYAQAEATRRDEMVDAMVKRIDSEVTATVARMAKLTDGLGASAKDVSTVSAVVDRDTDTAATAAGGSLASAQTVAAAAEELHASIGEIGRQVAQTTSATADAVERMRGAQTVIGRLNGAAEEIGHVVGLISDIAGRTNLLALNATIEAARAGEAGRGFAVVASEVKGLAGQSARSTEEIRSRIATIQAVVGETMTAMQAIADVISDVERTATAIAAAVEQQTAATSEIARSVCVTAGHAGEVANLMDSVKASVLGAHKAASVVSESADTMSQTMDTLGHLHTRALRTSSRLADRRGEQRRAVLLEGELQANGRGTAVRIYDLSEHGMMLSGADPLPRGTSVVVAVAEESLRLQGQVVHSAVGDLHVAFTKPGLSAGQVERIADSSISRLVKVTKADHLAFVQAVADAVAGKSALEASKLSTHHTCRLGKWCDSVSDERILHASAFAALQEPHVEVHAAARATLVALQDGRAADVDAGMARLRAASQEVLATLDRLGVECCERKAA